MNDMAVKKLFFKNAHWPVDIEKLTSYNNVKMLHYWWDVVVDKNSPLCSELVTEMLFNVLETVPTSEMVP